MSTPLHPRTTAAFHAQAAVSFAVSVTAAIGIKLLAEQDVLRVTMP